MSETLTGRTAARVKAIDAAMRALYGSNGPDTNEIDVDAIRQILGAVFDAGTKAKSAR